MSIHIATTALVYIVLLVLTYETIIFTSSNEEKSEEDVINKAYHNAYSIPHVWTLRYLTRLYRSHSST